MIRASCANLGYSQKSFALAHAPSVIMNINKFYEGRHLVKAYWYMNMKQGSDGDDFAGELWNQDLVGVLETAAWF